MLTWLATDRWSQESALGAPLWNSVNYQRVPYDFFMVQR